MKFTIAEYEIDIKVKNAILDNSRFNKQDTLYFMNSFLSLLYDSAELGERKNAEEPKDYYIGEHGTIERTRRVAERLFKQLDAYGLYDHPNN